MNFSESDIVQMHVPCPDCGSHDAMTIYTNGTYCFSCHKTHKGHHDKRQQTSLAAGLIPEWDYGDLPARLITEATCRRYQYGKATVNGETVQIANYMDDEGNILFQKIRKKEKKFSVKGTYIPRFYGQHLFSGGRKLVITEGEIDRLITALRSLIEETGAGIIVVSHLRKTDLKGTPFETGGTISLDDLRGSGSLKQIPDTVLALERNQQEEDETKKNLLKLRILKCRFTGNTGIADYVRFNKTRNRIEPIDPLLIKEITSKGDEPF